ncbi:MAG: ATP-binding protein [Bacteroidota bacterium]|nr:ATP-binding protein [Bacteroidota bacterium]
MNSIIIIVIIFVGKAYCQPYYFRHYQVENGLSNNTVYFIRQDAKGFMWFATKDGLNRFDGFHFKVFHINSADDEKIPATAYIFCLLPNKDGTLWVGAQKGLYKFNPQKERLEPFIDTLANVFDITLDKAGQLWFISSNTICRYNFKTNSLKQFFPAKYFNATSICLAKDGSLWASTDNGSLEKYNTGAETFTSFDMFSHSKVPASRWIQKIYSGDNNSIFVGTTSQGLKIFNQASSTYSDVLTYNPDKTTIYVRDILQTSTNQYWIATESGIFIYNIDTKSFTNLRKKFQDPYSLNDNAIYALCKDAEGNIWAGTFFGGVNYYTVQNASFKKYFPDNTQNSIGGNAVREICKDQYNNLWIGTEDGGLNKINNKTNKLTRFEPTGKKTSIAYTNIHGLLADGQDLWIGTFEHGIDVMDIKTGRVKKHFMNGPGDKDLKSNFALCFLRAKDGKKFLIGTSNGLYYYDKKKNEFTRPSEIPGNIFVTSIIEDHNSRLWVGTNNQGAYWFDPVTHTSGHIENQQNNKNSLSNNSVNDVYEDSNYNMWFATDGGGLCKQDYITKKFLRYTANNGLPGNFVFKILEDANKRLWATTSKGLLTFGQNFEKPFVFTQANGLLNNQFNYHSGYKDQDGRLYFGSVKGMISFVPGDFQKGKFVPPVYITGLQVFNKDLDPNIDSASLKKSIICAQQITLPYYQSSISFDFAALSYVAPEMTEYKYKLENLDKEWTTIKTNRKVYFTNLSPGEYVFKIKAATNGIWSANEKQIIITIKPPIWATTWAYLLYAVLTILILYYLISNYHKRQREKKEKEIYESKIDFFTNVAHEIRTPLTLIKGPVENLLEKKYEIPEIIEDLECLDRNTNRLTNLVSQILDFRQTEIKSFTLDFTRVNVNEILRETSLSFKILADKRKLDYELILPTSEVYALADGEALQKIFSNLIGNAVKYADKKVEIKLYALQKNSDAFTIKFENDGHLIKKELSEKIFEPFYRIKETNHKKGTGIGLTLTKSLIELHNGTITLDFIRSSFNTFVLTLPLQPEEEKKQMQLQKQPLL